MNPFEFHGGFLVSMSTEKNDITDLKSALKTFFIGLLFCSVSFHVKIVLQNVKNLIMISAVSTS